MQAVANNPEFAKKVGVNQSIGQEFTKENRMKKNYMYGGKVKKMMGGGMTDKMGRAMAAGKLAGKPGMMADAGGRAMMKQGGATMHAKGKKMNMGGATMGARGKKMADMEGRAMASGKLSGKPDMMADARGRAMKNGGAIMKAKGKKMQGYNARLDDSLGARNGKKKQSMKSRRDESKGAKTAAGKKAYSGNRKSAQGSASKRADGIAQRGRTRGKIV